MEYLIKNFEDYTALINYIRKYINVCTVITLRGDLGSGKTSFAGILINYLAKFDSYDDLVIKDITKESYDDTLSKRKNDDIINVISPTYNILQTYDISYSTIYHFDLYRLKSASEIYELGFQDALDSISIIEWPEIIDSYLPNDNIINIEFFILDNGFRKCVVHIH